MKNGEFEYTWAVLRNYWNWLAAEHELRFGVKRKEFFNMRLLGCRLVIYSVYLWIEPAVSAPPFPGTCMLFHEKHTSRFLLLSSKRPLLRPHRRGYFSSAPSVWSASHLPWAFVWFHAHSMAHSMAHQQPTEKVLKMLRNSSNKRVT